MSDYLYLSLELQTITCCNTDCGITFAVPASWKKRKRDDHSWFYCPNGHHQHYPAESREEKLTRELKAQKDATQRANRRLQSERIANRERLEAEKRSKASLKGHLTRIKKRIAAGVCPCCKRPFSAVMRHMRGQHPDFVEKWGLAPAKSE